MTNVLLRETLDAWADNCKGEPPALEILQPVFKVLEEMHSAGKAHGNIRPEAIVISDEAVDVTHFRAQVRISMDRASHHAPPEAHLNPPQDATPASDVYSLAAVIYHAMTGQPPVRAARRRESGRELSMAGIKRAVVMDALRRGLSMNPQERPQTAGELRELLSRPEPPAGAAEVDANSVAGERIGEGRLISSAAELTRAVTPTGSGSTLATPVTRDLLSARTAPPPKVVEPPAPPAPRMVDRLGMNLTAGKACSIAVASLFKEPAGQWRPVVLNADELGLTYDSVKNELSGSPSVSGEHALRLELLNEAFPDRPKLERRVAVTINPDPDSLWKDLPSNKDDPYYKPDTAVLEISSPAARLLGASQRGRSHAHEGLLRDDDFSLAFQEQTGWHLLVAADGAGSAKFSRRGSRIACGRALEFLEQWAPGQMEAIESAVEALSTRGEEQSLRTVAYSWLGGAAFEARKAIQSEADSRSPQAATRDYATTLLLAAAKLYPSGWAIVTFSVGDGGIALLRTDGQPKALCTPDSGEFSGQTVFLTGTDVMGSAEKIMQRVHVALEPNVAALLLMTDGVTDPKFPTEASLSDAAVWKEFWADLNSSDFDPAHAGAPDRLLQWLSFRSPGNHDDRTITLLLPKTGGTVV